MLSSFKPFIEYWLDLRGAALVPRREDFHPFHVKEFMGRIVIIERLSRMHFQVRLVGTEIVTRLGHDHTGEDYLNLLNVPENAESMADLFNAVLDQPMGIWGDREMITSHGTYGARFLHLPILHKASHAGEFFTVADFDQPLLQLSGVKFLRFGKLKQFALLDIGAGIPADLAEMPVEPLRVS